MKKKVIQININFSNRFLYTFIALAFLVLVSVGVYAATGVHHLPSEITGLKGFASSVIGGCTGENSIKSINVDTGVVTCEVDSVNDFVTSDELDKHICSTDGKIMKRSGGKWVCGDLATTLPELNKQINSKVVSGSHFTTANEVDPQVNFLFIGQWCKSNSAGRAIDCTFDLLNTDYCVGGTCDSDVLFNLNPDNNGQDNLFLTDNVAGHGKDRVGGSIAFGGPHTDKRLAAIAAIQYPNNPGNRIGLAFYTHGGAGIVEGSSFMKKTMVLDHGGNLHVDSTISAVGGTYFGTSSAVCNSGIEGLVIFQLKHLKVCTKEGGSWNWRTLAFL